MTLISRSLATLGVAVSFHCGDRRVMAEPMELDPHFGEGGVSEILFPLLPSNDRVTRTHSGAQMADGRLVLLGQAAGQMAMARLMADGSPDLSFGEAGRLIFAGVTTGTDVLVQPDGKILVSGRASQAFVGRLLLDGSLDPAFADDGTFELPGSDPFGLTPMPRRLALLADGRIMIAAESRGDWMLVRLMPNGTLDPSWGTTGVRILDVQGNQTDEVGGLAVLPDGRVLVGGVARSGDGTTADLAVIRFRSSGVVDAGFAANGRFVYSLGDREEKLNDMVMQADGRPVLLTSTYNIPPARWQHSLLRLTAQGALDDSFDGDGRVDFTLAGTSESAAVVEIDASHRIVVVGSYKDAEDINDREDMAVVRFTASGALDSTFDGDGMAVFDLSGVEDYGTGLALQGNEGMIVTGQRGSVNSDPPADFVAVRLDSSGKLDRAYDGDGVVTLDIRALQQLSVARALAIQHDGRIVLAGLAQGVDLSTQWLGVARLLPSGTLDRSYGYGGALSLRQIGAASCIALQPDGKAVVGAQFPVGLVRLHSTGVPDAGFGVAGIVKFNRSTFQWSLQCLHVLDDGRILAAGGADPGFLLLRLLPNGGLDPGFGTDGITITQIGPSDSVAQAMAIQDGKIVLAGYTRVDGGAALALARYSSEGMLDPSFSGDGVEITALSGGSWTEARGVTKLPDGKLAVAGSFYHGQSQRDAVLLRYQSNGGLDTSFGAAGVSWINSYLGEEEGLGLALDPNGDVLVAGPLSSPDRNNWLLARIGSNGLLSAPLSLRYGPARPGTVWQRTRGGQAIAVDASGNIVVAGCNEENMVVMRYKAATGRLFHSYAEWAAHHFTETELLEPGLVGPTADFDGDGVANAFEHVLDADPKVPGNPLSSEFTTMAYPGRRDAQFSFSYPASLPKNARLVIERTTTPFDPLGWTVVETKGSDGYWTPGSVFEELLHDGRRRAHSTFTFPGTSSRAFFRLRVLAP